ncbi:MAG: hypothetical protein FJ312_09270 [SAR202 cluster bacterium]|nr:hypothetical protein [SAR202 cluster bacterium]
MAVMLAAALLPGCGLLGGGEEATPAPEAGEAAAEGGGASSDLANQVQDLFDQLQVEKTAKSALETELAAAKTELAAYRTGAVLPEGVEPTATPTPLISLERAGLVVIRYAQNDTSVYGPDFENLPLIWEVEHSEAWEEFYYVNLKFKFAGRTSYIPGTEQFIVDKTGKVEFRQVLTLPREDVPEPVTAPSPE